MDRMRHPLGLVAAATLVAFPFDAARSQRIESEGNSAEAQAALHVQTARQLAGTDLTPTFDFFCVPGNARPNNFSAIGLFRFDRSHSE